MVKEAYRFEPAVIRAIANTSVRETIELLDKNDGKADQKITDTAALRQVLEAYQLNRLPGTEKAVNPTGKSFVIPPQLIGAAVAELMDKFDGGRLGLVMLDNGPLSFSNLRVSDTEMRPVMNRLISYARPVSEARTSLR